MNERALVQHYAAVRSRLYGPERRRCIYRRPAERQWDTQFNYPPTPPSILWRRIVWECAIKHGVTVDDVMGYGRRVVVVRARHEAMRRIYREVKAELTWVGRLFDRDHSCVINAFKRKRQKWQKKK